MNTASTMLFLSLAISVGAQSLPEMRMTPQEAVSSSTGESRVGSAGLTSVHTKVVYGDPSKAGFYSILLFVPARTTIQAHSHRDDRIASVVSGNWLFGYGEHFDVKALKRLSPGSVYSEPGGVQHFAQTENDPTILQISGYGPTDTIYFDPANDPAGPAKGSAALGRTPEDPKLVWTPSSVVLVSKELAPNVYAVYPDDAGAKNAAGVPAATSGGFIVGDDGVLVVDSMINRRLAEQLIALVRSKTAKPIRYVVNTSYHGDHSYGNQFFPRGVQFIQHANTQAYIQSHFAEDVAFMQKFFGTNQGMDELRPQRAQILVGDRGRLEVDLGNKRVQIMHLGFAQTEGDLFVWLPAEKVLYTGNPIISNGPSIPWLLDGKVDAALATLHELNGLVPRDTIVVPGHGQPTGVDAIEHHLAYLEDLKSQAGKAVADGLSESQTVDRLASSMAQYSGYKIFPWVHSQVNVPKTYQEIKQSK